jgi:hypothetical protein
LLDTVELGYMSIMLIRPQTKLYAGGLYMKSPPVAGAKEGLLKLKEMGYE